MAMGLAATSGLWTLASALLIALRGDLSHPWRTLDGTQGLVSTVSSHSNLPSDQNQFDRWIAIEVTGLLLECALFAMSTALVWGLQMKLMKRAQILSAFGVRLL
jgi:hypothetical protein